MLCRERVSFYRYFEASLDKYTCSVGECGKRDRFEACELQLGVGVGVGFQVGVGVWVGVGVANFQSTLQY